MNFRWIEGPKLTDDEWIRETERIERVLLARGWMSLNKETSMILVAEDGEHKLTGFYVLQFIPHVEPMWVIPSQRGSGLADDLADRMQNFLIEHRARGYVVTAESPFVAEMCEKRGMHKVDAPVYVAVAGLGG